MPKIYHYILINHKKLSLVLLQFNIKLNGKELFAYFQYMREMLFGFINYEEMKYT